MDFYMLGKDETLRTLKSRIDGLNSEDVLSRQEKYGKNVIVVEKSLSFFRLFLRQFKNYLVWLLIVVAIIAFGAGFYLNKGEQLIDGVVISLIVLINSLVGAYQDYKSEKSAQLLKSMLKTEAVVIREDSKMTLDASELVPGDIILLGEGDKVPADCRIIESRELNVDESMLTGESVQVLKSDVVIDKEVSLAERKNLLFMNTFVARGSATCVVFATGKDTEVGQIAKSLGVEQKSLFLKEVDNASKKITYVAMTLILIALSIYFLHDHSWISIFMLGSALIIGSIPEGLPAIVTFALSMGSSKLAKENVLVKRKTLLETLGSVDVICTDKTGTLTENRMTVRKIFAQGKVFESVENIDANLIDIMGKSALLCNEAKDTAKGFVGCAEDVALVDFFGRNGVDIISLRNKYPSTEFEPFSSESKFASSVNKIGSRDTRFSKGAPEVILSQCSRLLSDKGTVRLTSRLKEDILNTSKEFSKETLRIIAFSYDDVFIGLMGMHDPPKSGITEVVESIYQANMKLKMITGDNVHTAEAIARECGFKDVKAISWDEIKDMSDEELKSCVKEYNIFARMSPDFKLKIVSAIQANRKRVAITGDGVNDVPALKKADVGVAMGLRGSDIAKEASDLIILDDNLKSIVKGIKEGRTIFSNMRKVINYLLTANLAEVLLVFITSLFGLMPFLAIQLLWVNFVTDIAPAMTLGIDPSHKDIMKKKPTGRNEKLINKRIVWLTVGISVKKVIIMLAVFLMTLKLTDNLVLAQTMTFTWLVLSHFIRVAAIRFDEDVNFFVNKYLNWSIFIPVVLQLFIIYTPISKFFRVVHLTIIQWLVLIGAIMLAIGLAKIITYIIDKNLPLSERDY